MGTSNNKTICLERPSFLSDFGVLSKGDNLFSLDLLSLSAELQKHYEDCTTADDRKRRGQFFTPPSVARFMAKLFTTFPERIRLLDPGAGTGVLAAAVCERVQHLRSSREIVLDLFETDTSIIPLLEKNMDTCRSVLERAGHNMTYTVYPNDFILSNPLGFKQRTPFEIGAFSNNYDVVIMNPPYFKIAKDSQYAQLMNRIIHGQPNIYALFMALSAKMVCPGGELVAITPRSFCNGLYFREFRRWYLKQMSIKHIHLFKSRTDAFRGAKVLQESIITLAQKSEKTPKNITISTSIGQDLHKEMTSHQVSTGKIVSDECGNMMIRIPENPKDSKIMNVVEAWPKRFSELGLCISTGPVVMFRAKEFLLKTIDHQDSIPLLSGHNVKPFKTIWPVDKKNKPVAFKLCNASLSRRLVVPTKNYVLLKRFSSKEERRRLTASCFLKNHSAGSYVALENHLNYIYHMDHDLSDDVIYGIAALFNSALLDRYFRTISGNTQVNATEIRTMKFPDMQIINKIGKRIRKLEILAPDKAEHIVIDELGINGTLEQYLKEFI